MEIENDVVYQLSPTISYQGYGINRIFPFIHKNLVLGSYKNGWITVHLGSLWKNALECGGFASAESKFLFWLCENISHELFHHFCRKEMLAKHYIRTEEKFANLFSSWIDAFRVTKR